MQLTTLDWTIVFAFFLLILGIGLWASRSAGRSYQEFFLSGRHMPWWLLGVSMVATTFSADTPNLVTDIVRKNGVAGNWVWWAFLLTGMLTVFVYAKLWQRSGVLTDLEFYELRYSGKSAAFLRGFRALYLGVLFNLAIMASVTLAAVKIGGVLLGLSPFQTVFIASLITVIYSALGGLRGVILTDFVQFLLAMGGVISAAVIVLQLPEVNGLSNLLSHPNVSGKLDLLPDFSDPATLVPLFLIPIAVQWWSVWYPGAEPGGGGYVAQRMLAARNESHAVGATFLFNIAHYALRPWPWLLIALASLIVFPDLAAIQRAFPALEPGIIDDDLAFPAMLTFLPSGLLGLVVASLIAAYMSTISTHLNWGSSYLVHDFYKRFIKPEASQRALVRVGRISTVLLMAVAALLALELDSALQAFNIILQIGAGTGLLFILRWFWWRINAYSEIAAMVISFAMALFLEFGPWQNWPAHHKLLTGVGITTLGWLLVTAITRPADQATLERFYRLIRPHSFGWKPIAQKIALPVEARGPALATELAAMLAGTFAVWGALFTTGYSLYGQWGQAALAGGLSLLGALFLILNWKHLRGLVG